jgi:thioredoxin 2
MADPSHVVCPHCRSVNRVPPGRPAAAGHCGSCHGALFDGHPVEVDEAGFDRHLNANGIAVLLDVWAPWCGPCRTMAPMFERAASILEPRVRLLKLNADTSSNVTARLGVRGIPTIFLFREGALLAQQSGGMTEGEIVRWTNEALARPMQQATA